MIIEWYPGHMKRARAQILEMLPKIDLVIEVLDARLPLSSSNPLLDRLRREKDKPCLKILNKADLADAGVTKMWLREFEKEQNVKALALEGKDRREVGLVPRACRTILSERAKAGKSLRILVVGIPNVGKSTLINTLAGKKIARVGDKAGITTCPQQIDLRNGILLSDTPGLLWPVLDQLAGACRLAASGAIGDNAFDTVAVALVTLEYLVDCYPQMLKERYKLDDLAVKISDLLELLGRKRGCLISGGEVDLHRSAELLLREFRAGKLGRISLERPATAEDAFTRNTVEI
jgi:ribosome biogenesis GTPase A